MGKKRIIKKEATPDTPDGSRGGRDAATGEQGTKPTIAAAIVSKKKHTSGVLHIQSTYNNTLINLTDRSGNSICWSTSGSLGFKGAKKGTPFASAKVAELLAEKANAIGIKDVDVIVKGVGAGRESAIRAFSAKGIEVNLIRDITPIPHNGPKPPKPRRV